MAKKQGDGSKNKKRTERTLKQLNAKKNISNNAKATNVIKIEGKKPATQLQLFEIQKTLSVRLDTALMSTAALAEIMVKKELCTWDDFKKGEQNMLSTLKLFREAMQKAIAHFGDKTNKEDIGTFIYENIKAAYTTDKKEISDGVLDVIFGIKKSESRIIKPNQVSLIRS